MEIKTVVPVLTKEHMPTKAMLRATRDKAGSTPQHLMQVELPKRELSTPVVIALDEMITMLQALYPEFMIVHYLKEWPDQSSEQSGAVREILLD